jgi:hypothetical protein
MKFISEWPNELDYLIAAAKWKQVFGSKAHLCRAHLDCLFNGASEIQRLFCFSINRSARVTVIPVDAQTANQILVTHSRKRLWWDDNCRGAVIGSYNFLFLETLKACQNRYRKSLNFVCRNPIRNIGLVLSINTFWKWKERQLIYHEGINNFMLVFH